MILDVVMYVLFAILAIGALLPSYWTWRMVIYYSRHTRVTPPILDPCPQAAVILCLRGADPSLDACLNGLLNQDYPRYRVEIVVDHREDSAWHKVQEILARGVRSNVEVQVSVLEKHCPTCSLKACAQLQVVERLGDELDVVVLIDADSIPAADWLRALVLPLADPSVGATSGIRWFAPVDCGWGSLIRYVFNAGSYPQMFAFDHAWGGSVAIRADVFRRSSLKSRWCRALCEDSAITGPLRELGLKLVFVPAATNINTESINFQASLRFIQRQLLCVRLDHVDWPVLLAYNLFNATAVVALLAIAAVGIGVERWDWFAVAVGLLVTFSATLHLALMTAEVIIRRNHRLRGLNSPAIVWTFRMIPAFIYTQFVCMKFLWRAHFLKQVAWRGINYAIRGPGDISLEKYEAYQPQPEQAPDHSAV